MAFEVTLYSFTKRKNSTLQPSGGGVDLNCELKQPTSYKNPVFLFFVEDGFPWNYLQWDDWYYFIEDVVSVRNDLFEVHCSLDVLATYKAEIGATSAFVLYDTTANTEIIDTRLSQKTTAIQTYASSAPVFTLGNCILLGIVGDGGVGIYSVSQGTANNILNSINNWLEAYRKLHSKCYRYGWNHVRRRDQKHHAGKCKRFGVQLPRRLLRGSV